jgi:glycogen debranching enzyme
LNPPNFRSFFCRGIYKDTLGSKTEWADYQLRPNQVVAMVVAPDLFQPGHARTALQNIEKVFSSLPF